ncbi:MAG: metallophosphoesterase, partial [Spirochaetaceae bacterium]
MIFDIIGDIHGHARALEGLLEMLGYREHGGVYRSSESGRMALFVGDIVDRGPQIPRALQIVRNMVDEGEARMVLGNHEYNLVAWYTPLSAERRAQVEKEYGPIEGPLYVRPRTERHAKQCEQTILQFAGQENVLKDYLEWMQQQPLFLDLPDLRIVHAAWHPQAAATVKEYSPTEHRLTDQLLHASSFPGSPGYLAIEYLLKGVEVSLPPGMFYHDKEGAVRRRSRTAWWQRPE